MSTFSNKKSDIAEEKAADETAQIIDVEKAINDKFETMPKTQNVTGGYGKKFTFGKMMGRR